MQFLACSREESSSIPFSALRSPLFSLSSNTTTTNKLIRPSCGQGIQALLGLYEQGPAQSLKQKHHQYTTWPQKSPRSRAFILCVVGCMHTSSTRVDAREGNFEKIQNMKFLAIRTKARTVVGEGEECLACDPPDMLQKELQKGGSLTK